jgi:hypothetical protein
MPLVQVDLPRALFEEKGTQIGDEVHQAFIDALEVPADDRFQIFRPREAGRSVWLGLRTRRRGVRNGPGRSPSLSVIGTGHRRPF